MAAQDFGNYTFVKKLATGGMAEVWQATQRGIGGFNRPVVIKRILPHLADQPEFVQMFLNEARIAARFSHPNIAQIFDLGEADGAYYIAMEYVHGHDLSQVMRRAVELASWIGRPTAFRIVADACAGLYYAHTRLDEQGRPLKVVHRDISPQNIILSFDGAVKLLDFGIAKAADQVGLTKNGALKGKFSYMAPEQAGGRPLDARTDIFAMGLVLYELVTGVPAIRRDSELATLQAAIACDIRPPSAVAELPSSIDEVVMRALARDPADRYEDARKFQLALEQDLVAEGTIATSVQVSELMGLLFAPAAFSSSAASTNTDEDSAKHERPLERASPPERAPAKSSSPVGDGPPEAAPARPARTKSQGALATRGAAREGDETFRDESLSHSAELSRLRLAAARSLGTSAPTRARRSDSRLPAVVPASRPGTPPMSPSAVPSVRPSRGGPAGEPMGGAHLPDTDEQSPPPPDPGVTPVAQRRAALGDSLPTPSWMAGLWTRLALARRWTRLLPWQRVSLLVVLLGVLLRGACALTGADPDLSLPIHEEPSDPGRQPGSPRDGHQRL
jgi:serine/threonine protein kinase